MQKAEHPYAEDAKVSQKAQKNSQSSFFLLNSFCDFCETSAPSAFRSPIS
jgi:hypothetical protein